MCKLMQVADMAEELKTIKITESAHKGLQLAKTLDGIKMTEWVSTLILEGLERDCPVAYQTLREQIIKNKSE